MQGEDVGVEAARLLERFIWRICFASVAILSLALFVCSAVSASLPEEDPWGGHKCTFGTGAGECIIPRGVAADSRDGHIFVADQSNARVNEFNALGQFVKTWGWDVVASGPDNTGTGFEICIHDIDACKAGTEGSGVGQFSLPEGVAVDSEGNVYVVDFFNFRVQKFDPKGNFLLTFGGGVDQGGGTPSNPGDLCTAEYLANGDVCGQGTETTDNGEFGGWRTESGITIGSFIAITSTDKVYVGDNGRIQRFNTGGEWQENIPLPGVVVQSLAADSSGNLYYANKGKPVVRKIGPGGEALSPTFELPRESVPTGVAVDVDGNIFAIGPIIPPTGTEVATAIIEFAPQGNVIAEFGKGEFDVSTGLATNLCPGSEPPGNLYASNATENTAFIRAYGTTPVGCFKARTLPPTNVEETSATLNGSVNPSGLPVSECFFEWGETTSYGEIVQCEPEAGDLGTGSTPVPVHADIASLQKATAYHYRLIAKVGAETETGGDEEFKAKGPPSITEGHAVSVVQSEATLKALVNPEGLATSCHFDYGTSLSYGQSTPGESLGQDREAHVVLANLKSLVPGTTYHWRIVCTNSSGGAESGDRIFSTYLPFAPETSCPNQAFRIEASAFLPDCRAYEMVSPVDKNGGDIIRGSFTGSDPDGYTQSTPEGNKITYTSLTPFGELPSAVNFNQYLSERTERGGPGEGWVSRGIGAPVVGYDAFNVQRQYMVFTPDLCQGWLFDEQKPPLSAEAVNDSNLYRRRECEPGEGGLEALTDVAPPVGTSSNYVTRRSVQGVSGDGDHAFFTAKAKLTPEAPEGDSFKLYDRFGGEIHLVSVGPDGAPTSGGLGAGTAKGEGWQENLATAVSPDGSRVYWAGSGLNLRLNPEQPQSAISAGACSEPAKACTIEVGGGHFWAASPDGFKAIFTEGGELLEFDLERYEEEEEASLLLANTDDVLGVAGVSEDLSHVYFVSRDALDGGSAGQPNLYLTEGGSVTFIATLSEKDVGERESGANAVPYDLTQSDPYFRATRVSANGQAIAFNSRAPLTGYDNTDSASGKAAVEVFVYEAGSDELQCASCNPGGARPQVLPEMHESYAFPWDPGLKVRNVPAAAFLPTWEQPTYASRPLSANGQRLFFNSYDDLLPRDTNGQMDVYEWELAGTGSCKATKGNPSYFAQRGGCVYLISSGESSYESEFWEASADGSDVFFTTESSLVPPDPGSIDLYDARVGGGFPYPVAKPPCEGEACQSPPPAPNHPTPPSLTSPGNGNVEAGRPDCSALSRRAKHLKAAARKAGRATPAGKRLSKRAKGLAKRANRCRRANQGGAK